VFTLAARWELEQLPSPIRRLDNPDLPLTQHLPALGSQWGPRAGFAWGSGESRWPVLRLGYGMYFGRTPNTMIQTALTQTGSSHGDLKLFMRPTDNLSGLGAPPFPYVLTGEPGTSSRPQAVEFAPSFRNSEVHQAEMSLEEALPAHIHLDVAGVASLGRRLPVTMDVGQFHGGLPYSMHTAGSLPKEFDVNGRAIVGLSTGMNGYGGDNRVYGIGRNTYRYPATWKADLRLSKKFNLGQMRQLELMASSFAVGSGNCLLGVRSTFMRPKIYKVFMAARVSGSRSM
jgi:hypothetical protein